MSAEMPFSEWTRKLLAIADLSAEEIDGYEAEARARGWFDGEKTALLARRRQLALGSRLRRGMR